MKKFLLATIALLACAGTARADVATDKAAIIKELNAGCAAFISGNAKASIAFYLPNVLVFDVAPPRQKDFGMVEKFNQQMLSMVVGKPVCIYEEIDPVILTPEYAYSTSILHTSGKIKGSGSFDFRERSTDIYQKVDGVWRVMHEHNSVPVNVMTGQADLLSTP